MIRLYICEKPSLAKALAENLGSPYRKDGYYEVNGDYVAWLKGHIMELLPPDSYKDEWKRENNAYDVLPIIPDTFVKEVKTEVFMNGKRQKTNDYVKIYDTLAELEKKCDIVVNVGDPDREGQYLVDEVLEKLGSRKPQERLFINAYDDATIKRALATKEDNKSDKNVNMFRSAKCRDMTDWLIGMNGSRKFSLDAGFSVKVGRVQVPILALISRRNDEIDNFVSVKYYAPESVNMFSGKSVFNAKWKASEDAEGLDSEGRLIDKSVAEKLQQRIKGKPCIVKDVEKKHCKENPRLPFSLATLQKEACSKLGITLKELDVIMQELYEKKKLVTYPRSDCNYIPDSQFGDAGSIVLNLLHCGSPAVEAVAKQADTTIKNPCFNTSKTSAHHAIIPTGVKADISTLSTDERGVYEIIALRYLMQFYPLHEYDMTTITLDCDGEIFIAKGKTVTVQGWKALLGQDDANDGDDECALPVVAKGEQGIVSDILLTEKNTTPPARISQESLITALCNAHLYVKDKSLRDVVKNIKGLGTPATRSKIIDGMLADGRLYEDGKGKKKYLYVRKDAKELIACLPDELTYPDQTALMELDLDKVAQGDMTIEEYKAKYSEYIRKLMTVKSSFSVRERQADAAHPQCPVCKQGILYQHDGKNGKFWGCSRYKEGCNASFPDIRNKPAIFSCPKCKQGYLRKISGRNGDFWSCTRYKEGCNFTTQDNKGKPADTKPIAEVNCPECGAPLKKVNLKAGGSAWLCTKKDSGCKTPWFTDIKGSPYLEKCPTCKKAYLSRRKGPKGEFWGCTGYPVCKALFGVNSKGLPDIKGKNNGKH